MGLKCVHMRHHKNRVCRDVYTRYRENMLLTSCFCVFNLVGDDHDHALRTHGDPWSQVNFAGKPTRDLLRSSRVDDAVLVLNMQCTHCYISTAHLPMIIERRVCQTSVLFKFNDDNWLSMELFMSRTRETRLFARTPVNSVRENILMVTAFS